MAGTRTSANDGENMFVLKYTQDPRALLTHTNTTDQA